MGAKKNNLVMNPEEIIDKIEEILSQIAAAEDLKKETQIKRSRERENIDKLEKEEIKILNEEVKAGVDKISAMIKANRLKLEEFLGMKKMVTPSGNIIWSALPAKISINYKKIGKEELISLLQKESMERFLRWKITITLVAGKKIVENITRFFEKLKEKKERATVIIKPQQLEINIDALSNEPEVAEKIKGIKVLRNRESIEVRPRSLNEDEETPSYLKKTYTKK